MRGRRKAEPPLVADLLERLQPYSAQGTVCRGCRRWATEREAEAAGWSSWADASGKPHPYCPACSQREFGALRPLSL